MDVIAEARAVLLDTDSGSYRWTTARLAAYATEGQSILIANRPDAIAKNTDGLIDDPDDITDAAPTPGVYDEFHGAVVDYIVARALETDDGDEQNAGRAETHRKQFYERLGVR